MIRNNNKAKITVSNNFPSYILGLDLAQKVGACVLETPTLKLKWAGTIILSKTNPELRFIKLKKTLYDIISSFPNLEIAIEDVYLPSKTSHKTPIALGELRGIARLCAAEANIPVTFYTPTKIKQAITGYGRASKEDIMHWIEIEFNYKVKDHNEADAISIAYTHWMHKNFYSHFKF